MESTCEVRGGLPFLDRLRQTAVFLWKEWPLDMQATPLDSKTNFSLIGTCPHCGRSSVFIQVSNVFSEEMGKFANGTQFRLVVAMRCQGCLQFILGIAQHIANQLSYKYEDHYPLGKPDDSVAEEIPDHIKPDFKEALRCLWVDAYNATAEMCRRALEASCIQLGAPNKKVLEDMIDWLADQRIITPFLQKAAHKIRLGGNRGAHPSEDAPSQPSTESGLTTAQFPEDVVTVIEREHALAIVEFTRHFFQHVYVGPKQLDKYDFSKPKAVKP